MKKQFFRVKQLADQTVGRAEKTEVLSEDLLGVEKRVDNIKQACNGVIKKISICLMGQGPDLEKRLKKIPETFLSSALVEYSIVMGENTPMGSALRYCGEAMSYVGKDVLQYELDIEKKVLQPLNAILENHIPVINKFKKQLNKQTLEMDTCKTRYNEMLRRSYCTMADVHNNAAKIDALKEEYVDSCNKLDLIKDAYTTEMFKFLSKEGEISQILLYVIENQIEYHKNLMLTLDSIIVKAREYMSSSYVKPAFGCPLQEYLDLTNTLVSPIIEECILLLLEMGLDEQGLFRMTGSSSKIKKLRCALDSASPVEIQEFIQDPHVITGTLKLYLRELPEPLLTYKLYDDWSQAAKMPEETAQNVEEKRKAFAQILTKLPKPNYDNLNYLIQFLAMIVQHSEVNLMNSSNLSIVIGPNLLWKYGDTGMDLCSTNVQNSVTEYLIENCDKLFTPKIDFKTFENVQQATTPNYKEYEGHFSSLPCKTKKQRNGSAHSSILITKATSDENLNSTFSNAQKIPKDSIAQTSPRISKSINEIRRQDDERPFSPKTSPTEDSNGVWKKSVVPPSCTNTSLFPPHRYAVMDELGGGTGCEHLYTSPFPTHQEFTKMPHHDDDDKEHLLHTPKMALSNREIHKNISRAEKFPPLPPLPPPEKLMLAKRKNELRPAPLQYQQRQSLVTCGPLEPGSSNKSLSASSHLNRSVKNIILPLPSRLVDDPTINGISSPVVKPKILGSKPKNVSAASNGTLAMSLSCLEPNPVREARANLKLVTAPQSQPVRPPRKLMVSLPDCPTQKFSGGVGYNNQGPATEHHNGHSTHPSICPLARIEDDCGSDGDEPSPRRDNDSNAIADKMSQSLNLQKGGAPLAKMALKRNGTRHGLEPGPNNELPAERQWQGDDQRDNKPKPPSLPPPPKLKTGNPF